MEVAEKISFLFTDPESRALDKFAIHEKKIPSNLLMGFAAISIFDKYREMFRGKKIIIVCGTGNNGGDGLAISWFLYSSGESVSVFQKEGKYSEETEFYRSLLSNSGIRIESINFLDEYLRNCNNDPAVIVDCLLGTGFKPPLTGSYSEIIESINSFRKSNPLSEILSVDAASGFYPGPDSVSTGIRPDILAEIGTEKYNSIFISDPDIKKSVHEIGFPVKEFQAGKKEKIFRFHPIGLKEIALGLKRETESHKYKSGSACFIGGSKGMSGAIMLSQNAFHAFGGGISKIFSTDKEVIISVLSKDMSMMVTELDENISNDNFLKKAQVVAIGPGLSENHLSPTIEQILEMPKRFVIDAGGLPVVREKKFINDVLLTPHLGEFSSLTGKKNSSISDAIPDLREYAIAHNVNILLKSHISVFCNTLGHLYFWNFPNTKLAVMGTGDLLAGTLAVFLSKGFSVLDSVHFSLSFLDKSREMKSKYPTAFEIKIFLEESLKYV